MLLNASSGRRWLVVWGIIGLTMLGVGLDGSRHHFIPCAQNCGETFDALQYVKNYRLYGFKYGLVQDMATSPDPSAHPFLYIHNVNIAGILFTVLDAAGARALWAKQLLTLFAFGAGLFYVFRATAFHTRSWWIGFVLLLLFCTDFEYVLSFGLNALRAWHWLALFGLLFHTGRLALQPGVRPWLDRVAVVAFAVLSFGIGYDFWIVCLLTSLFILLFCLPRPVFSGRSLRIGLWICLAFAIPFVLRQIQIVAVLGPGFWALDLYYSAVIKMSVLSKVLPLSPIEEINRIYEVSGVLRPPATPASSVLEILKTFRDMVVRVTIPSAGVLSVILAIAVGGSAVTLAVLCASVRRRTVVGFLARLVIVGRTRLQILGACRLMAALVLGISAGVLVFAPVSLHIYLKHQFPLIAAPLLLANALVLGLAGRAFRRWRVSRGPWRWVALACVCFLIADHLIVQLQDLRTRFPLDVSWIDPVSESMENSTFAVSWIPSSVAVFTRNWVVGVQPGKERGILQRLKEGREPFTFSDYFLFGERDAKVNTRAYLKPDYWLYFPTDDLTPFDSPSPVCRQDYLTAFRRLLKRRNPNAPPKARIVAVWPVEGPPGTVLSIVGHIEIRIGPVARVELLEKGEVVGELVYNCQHQTYIGTYRVPTDAPAGVNRYQTRLVDAEGRRFIVGEVKLKVDPALPPSPFEPVRYRAAQRSVQQVIAENPNLKIATVGTGFVIFDLRPSYRLKP